MYEVKIKENDSSVIEFIEQLENPRKASISLYFAPGTTENKELLTDFGKHKTGKGCVYINKVTDIDVDI